MLVGQENGHVWEAASHIHLSSGEMSGLGTQTWVSLVCVDSTEDGDEIIQKHRRIAYQQEP